MKIYPMLIDGRDDPGLGWTYALRASALIADPERAFNLKRGLELGTIEPRQAGEQGDVLARCAWGDARHNGQALEAAACASKNFGRFSLSRLRAIGADFHQGLLAHADELVEILIGEGHPRRVAQWELSGALHCVDEITRNWCFGQFEQSFRVDGRDLLLLRKPDGVVCVNPPQNAAASNSAMGALALLAGNTLVVKAPKSTPTGVMFVYREIFQPVLERHGAPPGTLNVISGDTQHILKQWLASPHVDDVLFYGSSTSGLRFGGDCFAAGKKPILELSGNDGFLVWRDADLDRAAQTLTECFFGSSQICMVPKYAIVHPEIAEQLIAKFTSLVRTIRPGYPEDPRVVLSPVLKQDQFFDFLSEAREAGCRDPHGRRARWRGWRARPGRVLPAANRDSRRRADGCPRALLRARRDVLPDAADHRSRRQRPRAAGADAGLYERERLRTAQLAVVLRRARHRDLHPRALKRWAAEDQRFASRLRIDPRHARRDRPHRRTHRRTELRDLENHSLAGRQPRV